MKYIDDTQRCAWASESLATVHAGWVAAVLTSILAGQACDNTSRHRVNPPVVRRAFPETGDFRANPNLPKTRPESASIDAPTKATDPATGGSSAGPALSTPKHPPLAAVLLMFPEGDDPAVFSGPRTYKVSFGTNLVEARIEIDGRDVGTTPVRRVYPQPSVAGGARSAMPTPFAVGRRADGPGPTVPGAAIPAAGPLIRPMRRSPASERPLPTAQAPILNPNGAPIID